MTQDIVADFKGKLLTSDIDRVKPMKGRILLSRERLVLVTGSDKKTIIISNIVSTNPAATDAKLSQFFDTCVAIAYEQQGENRKQAVIGGSAANIRKFRTLLYKLLIGNDTVLVEHPAKRGGVVTETSPDRMLLSVNECSITLKREDDRIKLNVRDVVGCGHEQRELGQQPRPTLSIDHRKESTTVTTRLSLLSEQKLMFLSQFLRMNHRELMQDIDDIQLTDIELQYIIGLYTEDEAIDPQTIMAGEVPDKHELLPTLNEKELVSREGTRPSLTTRGEVFAIEQLDVVN